MANANKAHAKVLAIVAKLKASGIQATVTKSGCSDDEGLIARYKRPERATPSKWCRVTFLRPSQAQADRIRRERDILTASGIVFDTGGGCGGIDWELDWSFKHEALATVGCV